MARPSPRALRRPNRLRLVAVLVVLAACTLGFGGTCGYTDRGYMWSRQLDWLTHATSQPINPGSIGQLISAFERDLRSDNYSVPAGTVPDDAWDGIFEKMFRLRDTSDFDALRFVDLLSGYRGHPAVSEALWQKTEQAMIDFKYWYTDPTPDRTFNGQPVIDLMWYWTENHILIFHTVEMLMGNMFPDTVFSVAGLTGAEHAARARPKILRWLDERGRFGFTEWHSNVYYNLDMRPLLTLIEFSNDPEIEQKATMVLDLVLLDMALHLHRGTFGATHGRSYIKDKPAANKEDSFVQAKMLFDDTVLPYTGVGSASGAVFGRMRKYKLPEVIRRIARSDAPMWDRERMNLPLDEVPPLNPTDTTLPEAPFGLTYDDEENLEFWWSMGAQSVWQILPLTFEVGERENLWIGQFEPFAPLRDLVFVPGDPEQTILDAWGLSFFLWPMINQSLLKEVNTATYRTEHYMLSTAQDYRKGVRGSQTHTWQATLSEEAMVFTTHPAYLPPDQGTLINYNWQSADEPGPGYWSGEASQPRSAQHMNVGISIYSQQYVPIADFGFTVRNETHAYFPHAHMDVVEQQGNWTFGKKDEGYVALYSHLPTVWRQGLPEVHDNQGLDFDLVAEGSSDNVWIVECGSIDEYPGGFDAFKAAILAANVSVTPTAVAFDVVYDSPSQGELQFSWDGDLVVDGQPVSISDYKRFDNPFVTTEFGDNRYVISDGTFGLTLDFETGERTATGMSFDASAYASWLDYIEGLIGF
ncbi:MAG: hypothetical protein QNK05_21115 [Myxococcota bacterium]|nr:hypothetical protein [Myxococcota bacterium]